MKRFWIPLFALLSLILPLTASAAGHWVTKEIFWSVQGGRPGTTIVSVHDTLYNAIAAGQTDTTGFFSLQAAIPYCRGTYPVSPASDTLNVAWLLFTPDSAGVTAPTLSSMTVEIDGGIRGSEGNADVSGYAQVDSLVASASLGKPVFQIPIRAYGVEAGVTGNNQLVYQKSYASLAWPDLRARITAATGVMSACRAFVRYWTE